MKAPWEYFEDLHESVYVADCDTYELLYMNRFAREQFEIGEEDGYRGKKCYEVLQRISQVCPFCTNESLKENEFYEWSYRNPILKQTLMLKDTLIYWEGRRCRMEMALNIECPNATGRNSNYEAMVNDCLIQTHSTVDPNKSMNILLRFLGQKLLCDRADIYENGYDGALLHTYHWSSEDLSCSKESFSKDSLEAEHLSYLYTWYETFLHNEPIVLTNMEQFKKDSPELYAYLKPGAAETILLVPLLHKDRVAGFLRLDNPGTERISEAAEVCKILSHFIVAIWQRRELFSHLRRMSHHDQLTGALNRHALDEFIRSEAFQGPIGMVYCDIVGLKSINDLLGHDSGDETILRCYEAIVSAFSEEEVYRIGGDEFVILFASGNETEFGRRVERLRREIISRNCELSIGCIWSEEKEKNFRELLSLADDRMYQEKNNFYNETDPITGKRRRQLYSDRQEEHKEKNAFQMFASTYYFDAESFFRSVAMDGTSLYLYCGDMRKNVYYISENLRRDFNFSSNLVYDFVTLLDQRIVEEDRSLHAEEMHQMLEEKRTLHNIRYRVYNKQGDPVWLHCRGIMKWNEDKTEPLFFSGAMIALNDKSEIDTATGMMTFPFGLSRLSELCAAKEELMLICFSLRSFSKINQTLGRRTGDTILWEVGRLLRLGLGSNFELIRMDGMRFLAFSRTERDPHKPIQEIRQVISDVYRRNGAHEMYPCVVGMLRSPRDGVTAQELTENAMTLLRTAKDCPECEYLEFSPVFGKKERERADLSMALMASVTQNFRGFRIVIQPQVIAETGRMFGGEVLLRWEDEGVNVPPVQFIPILEETGLIIPVGKWVIEQIALLCQETLPIRPDFKLSFNVSYFQLADDTLFSFLHKTLARHHVPGWNVMLELTETHFDSMPGHLEQFIERCREIGLSFALDDFGNAYSSLQLLLKYPADLVKLDRTLMQKAVSSQKRRDFIMSIVYACHRFGKKVCMEGVENEEELSAARKMGADFIQGYYFYKPMELDRFHAILREQYAEDISAEKH